VRDFKNLRARGVKLKLRLIRFVTDLFYDKFKSDGVRASSPNASTTFDLMWICRQRATCWTMNLQQIEASWVWV